MAFAVCGDTLTDAWLADLEHLHAHNGEQLNLITTIVDPNPVRADTQMVGILDDWLLRKGLQRVDTVANTIFPAAYLRGCANRQEFYDRYLERLPRLKKQPKNKLGTYFGRLIQYPATLDVRRGATFNQIEAIIRKLEKQLTSNGPKRFAYQAQIFIPNRDTMSTMGFPCMSFVSFQLDAQKRLCLTAIYRNQYYFQRALGNFIGLARLQRFVAEATNLEQGSLSVLACHAKFDVAGKQARERLIRVCREHAAPAIVPR